MAQHRIRIWSKQNPYIPKSYPPQNSKENTNEAQPNKYNPYRPLWNLALFVICNPKKNSDPNSNHLYLHCQFFIRHIIRRALFDTSRIFCFLDSHFSFIFLATKHYVYLSQPITKRTTKFTSLSLSDRNYSNSETQTYNIANKEAIEIYSMENKVFLNPKHP